MVAMHVATEMIESSEIQVRIFGILIDGPADVLCENQSVVTNSSVPKLQLSKKHNAICYH